MANHPKSFCILLALQKYEFIWFFAKELWRKPIDVAGKEDGFFDIGQANSFFYQAVYAIAAAAVGRQAVFKGLQVVFVAWVFWV